MSVTKKYFHDRFVLFLLTINSFLVLVVLATVVFRLGDTSTLYVKQYQPNLGIDATTPGSVSDMLAFPIFAAIVFGIFSVFALKMYAIHKRYAWVLLLLATLLLLLTLTISYKLLSAH
jgi:hypothetical protein